MFQPILLFGHVQRGRQQLKAYSCNLCTQIAPKQWCCDYAKALECYYRSCDLSSKGGVATVVGQHRSSECKPELAQAWAFALQTWVLVGMRQQSVHKSQLQLARLRHKANDKEEPCISGFRKVGLLSSSEPPWSAVTEAVTAFLCRCKATRYTASNCFQWQPGQGLATAWSRH